MRWKRARWIILGVVVLLLGIGGWKVLQIGQSFARNGGGLAQVWQGIANPASLFPGKDRVVILVLGKDYNHDRRGILYTKNARADTIMLLSVDLNGQTLAAVSIPRDTKVTAPDGITSKINSVYARGGVELMRQTLVSQVGLIIDHYVVLKPDAVKAIVDELGGVTVQTLDEMRYDDNWGNLHVNLPKGNLRVNGQQAVGFVRFRGTSPKYRKRGRNLEEGDLRRTARQQQLVRSMIREATTASNLWKADSIIETGFDQIETDLTRTQVLALATLLKDSQGEMRSATLPGDDAMIDGIYYWVLDDMRAQRTLDWLLRGDQLAGRSVTKVAIYNATKNAGVAKALAIRLYSEGYDAWSAGNTKTPVSTSEVLFHRALHETHAADIAASLGLTGAKKEPADPHKTWGPDVTIRIGPDLATQLAPAPLATP